MFYYKHGFTTIPVWMVGISVIVVVLGLAWPPCVRFIYITWMAAVFPLGWVGSHIILFVVFFFVVTPIGLIMKTFGRDPMRRQFDRGAVSYWIARKPNSGTDRYFKQFKIEQCHERREFRYPSRTDK